MDKLVSMSGLSAALDKIKAYIDNKAVSGGGISTSLIVAGTGDWSVQQQIMEESSNIAQGSYSAAFGSGNRTWSEFEFTCGRFNNSINDGEQQTLFSVGNGFSDDERKNAFEIRQEYIQNIDTWAIRDIVLPEYISFRTSIYDQSRDAGFTVELDTGDITFSVQYDNGLYNCVLEAFVERVECSYDGDYSYPYMFEDDDRGVFYPVGNIIDPTKVDTHVYFDDEGSAINNQGQFVSREGFSDKIYHGDLLMLNFTISLDELNEAGNRGTILKSIPVYYNGLIISDWDITLSSDPTDTYLILVRQEAPLVEGEFECTNVETSTTVGYINDNKILTEGATLSPSIITSPNSTKIKPTYITYVGNEMREVSRISDNVIDTLTLTSSKSNIIHNIDISTKTVFLKGGSPGLGIFYNIIKLPNNPQIGHSIKFYIDAYSGEAIKSNHFCFSSNYGIKILGQQYIDNNVSNYANTCYPVLTNISNLGNQNVNFRLQSMSINSGSFDVVWDGTKWLLIPNTILLQANVII